MTDHQTTHAPGCWSWGPKHYECALREIEALRAEVERLRTQVRNLKEAAATDGLHPCEEAMRKMFGGGECAT